MKLIAGRHRFLTSLLQFSEDFSIPVRLFFSFDNIILGDDAVAPVYAIVQWQYEYKFV